MKNSFEYKRIAVVGSSGAGKSTMAVALAKRLNIPHIELDALHWEPNWTEAKPEVLRERVTQALSGPGWVVDGNYGKLRDLVWGQAEVVVWLDFTLPVVMRRLFKRTIARAVKRQELWSGNRESFRLSFFSRDSVLLWALRTHKLRHKENQAALAQPEYKHIKLVHLTTPKAAEDWLGRIKV